MKTKRIVVIIFGIFLGFAILPVSAADHATLAKTAYDKHIIPGYTRLVQDTRKLNNHLQKFCKEPEQESYTQLRADFKTALLAWSHMEHIQFGPITEDYKYERFAFWPDVKGRGLRQVRKILTKLDGTVLSLNTLSQKSVAVQGFTALEYLLYGTGYEVILSKTLEGRFRCKFAQTIAMNLARMSGQVLEAWKSEAVYTKAFLNPGHDKIYAQPREVTQELFQAYVGGFDKLKDMKLLRPLGRSLRQRSNYKRSAYWRSKLSMDVIATNIDALKSLYETGGFSKFVMSKKKVPTHSNVQETMNAILKTTKFLGKSINDILQDEAKKSDLKALVGQLAQVKKKSAQAIIDAADLTIGFNAQDGD